MHRFIRHLGIVVPSVLLLAACGGGGGGGGGGSSNLDLSERQLHGDLASANALAEARVNFGSVTQSSNTDGTGRTTDAIDTTFENGVLTVEAADVGGDRFSLNSREHTWMHFPENAPWLSGLSPMGTDSKEGRVLARQEGGTTTVAVVYTYWNDEDPTNYLAGGYWVRASNPGGGPALEQGVFADFGEGSIFYRGADGWTKPTTAGTATYRGQAEGSYLINDGDESGIWWSDGLRLTADFAASTIEGCIGCPGAGPISRYEPLNGDGGRGNAEGSIMLEQATIDTDGAFEGPVRVDAGGVQDSSGHWGGMFSDNDDVNTMPEAVGGTLGGRFTETGGTRGAFTGVFYGERP